MLLLLLSLMLVEEVVPLRPDELVEADEAVVLRQLLSLAVLLLPTPRK